MKKNFWLLLSAAMVVFATGCSKDDTDWSGKVEKGTIEAFFEELDDNIASVGIDEETRFGASEETLAGEAWTFFWEPGDAMGVFTDASEYNVKYVNKNTENASIAYFGPESATVTGTPVYAYYPYSADAGEDVTAIKSTLPSANTLTRLSDIPGMHRCGSYKETADGLTRFSFKQPFALVRFQLDAAGTKLEGQRVKSIKVVAKRAYIFSVGICGDVTINLEDQSYTASNTSNTMTFEFENYPTLETAMTFATNMLPKVKKYDRFYFTVEATGYTATFNVSSAIALAAHNGHTYSLPMANYSSLKVKTNDITYVEPEEPTDPEEPEVPTDPVEPETPTDPETPTEPTITTGTFTAATYNVKSSMSGTIGTYITNDKWDFFGLSEDFGNVKSNLSGYSFGKRTGSALSSSSDGLGFATRTETCSWSNEYIDAYDEEYGGLFDGANTVISKGFRMYTVTMKDGVEIDVYITHMNTYNTEKHLACQHAQLKEVATYIANHQNGRPVIFMGDTNCRYTRHDFETYFWSILREAGLTYSDPWVTYQWDGVYPTYPSKSLMVSDATGTNSETDIICSTTQNGEVVDKVIYINKSTNATQIEAKTYLRDMDYDGLSDHMPIVVEFSYTKTVTE